MRTKDKINFLITGGLFLIFVAFTLIVKFVGFDTLNLSVHSAVGVSNNWYDITEILGLIPILVAGAFAVLGLVQAIKAKSIRKIHPNIMFLGSIYCLLVGFYLFFEGEVINYRPILIDGVLEASYPSSHTLLACVILGTAIIWLLNSSLKKYLKICLSTASGVFALLIIVGRFLSGAHWLTDIIAGLILSATLIYLYYSLVELKKNIIREEDKTEEVEDAQNPLE